MSLGDEPVINQQGSALNNVVSAQKPVNCLSIPPSVSPPAKSTSINSSVSRSNGILMKVNSVPSQRPKLDRTTSKSESFENDSGSTSAVQRSRGNPKVKLLQRSHAVREETSPPRESEIIQPSCNSNKLAANKAINGIGNPCNNNSNVNSSSSINTNNSNKMGSSTPPTNGPSYQGNNNLQVTNYINRPSSRHKLRHQGSSQGSSDNLSPSLSRDSSSEQYTDNSGVDLNQFIAETLNRNYKDRMLLLQIEQDLISLVKDKRAYQKFPFMSSYQRMLVHRVAAFFGMEHNVDQSGLCVIVNPTPSTRIPEVRFSELIRDIFRFPEEPRRCILKRDSSSFEEGTQLRSPERQLSGDSRRSKSFEEREEEYERARKRIFNRDDGFPMGSPYRSHDANSRRSSHEDLQWHGDSQAWSSSDSDICNVRGRLLTPSKGKRISKVESYEGSDTLKANSLKSSVSKSYSFGGYPGMNRGDSVSSCSSRALLKQADSVTSSVSSTRLSPSSSGYKSQSIRSDATTSTTPSPNQGVSQCSFSPEPNTVVWAVSSLTAVPAGAVLINPASGQPYTNPDGSLYRYDPDNPIKLCTTAEEDTNLLSSPASGTVASTDDNSENVINRKIETSKESIDIAESSDVDVTAKRSNIKLINSSTSPIIPETHSGDVVSTKENKTQYSDSDKVEKVNKLDKSEYREVSLRNQANDENSSNASNVGSVEVAQTNYVGTENNSICNGNSRNCTPEGRNYGGQSNMVSYHLNYSTQNNVANTPEYGSHSAAGSAYLNSNMGVTPVNYAMGPPYPNDPVQMPSEVIYTRPIVYAAGQQANSFNMVHASASGTTVAAPPPPPPPPPLGASAPPASAAATVYESRPTELNPTLFMPELSNYFMGLNVGNEQIAPATTPAPQTSYWGPSPNASQTQGSNHSSQIQMYYLPGGINCPTGAIHSKYAPAAASVYTYNVPPVVYPTELCQSIIPNAAAPVIPAPYYGPAPATTVSYRAQTPPTPSVVAPTAVAPTNFFVYHPQQTGPPPPPPPPIQFGIVRPQQRQVVGIRSSPPPVPRNRVPYNRSMSERTRHSQSSVNIEPKTPNLHFSSSLYGLRFLPGELQSLGMMRPIQNIRSFGGGGGGAAAAAAAANSNSSHHSGNESVLTSASARPPRPRKQR